MNIVRIMSPAVNTATLRASQSVRQGLEVMRRYGYTAIPVLEDDGRYIGAVTEGDFLWHIMSERETDIREYEKHRIGDIVRKDFCQALEITAGEEQLVDLSLRQNFVPIVDARGCLCGIVTRRAVIDFLAKRAGAAEANMPDICPIL